MNMKFGAILLVGALWAPISGIDSDVEPSECAIAEAWVEENLDNLPSTYEEISTFDVVYRKAVYSRLSGEDRISLWRDHLTVVIEMNELNAEQTGLLAGIRKDLPALMGLGNAEKLASIEQRARAVLGDQLAGEALAMLGPPPSGLTGEACSCSKQSDWCPGGFACATDGDGCTRVDGCGTLWQYECDGECLSPE